MRVLVIGGSGFLGGTMVRYCLAKGYSVDAISRGNRPAIRGANVIHVDRRDRSAFVEAVSSSEGDWDFVFDAIAFSHKEAEQDVTVLSGKCKRLVLISSDFVIDPKRRPWCIDEKYEHYYDAPYATGKREAEEVLRANASFPWTVLRPCHIYGPGSKLGCLPVHARDEKLIDRINRNEPLKLAGGGAFLQQPVTASDVCAMALSCVEAPGADRGVFFCAGPEVIESWRYYAIIGEILKREVRIEEVHVSQLLDENPEWASFMTHRVYRLDAARKAGLKLPATSMREGLTQHVQSLMRQSSN